MEVSYRRMNNRPLYEELVEQITRRIVRGDLKPGSALPTEPVLCEQFGVSRTVVREAVRILVSMGLLEVRHGSGMRVRGTDEWDYLDPLVLFEQVVGGRGEELLDEVMEVRRIFEVEAAGLAARRRTEDNLLSLHEFLEAMREALKNAEEFTRLDVGFHECILSAARNRPLREAVKPINDVLKRGRFITNREACRRVDGALDSQRGHEEIYAAIARKDPDDAREATSRHIEQFQRDIHVGLISPDSISSLESNS